MAITVKLRHTFDTRVVFTSAELESVRKEMEVLVGKLQAALDKNEVEQHLSPKQVAAVKVSIERSERALMKDDENFVIDLVQHGVRFNLRKDMGDTFEHLNITRVSPVQTVVL
ncbi:hypothetical protein [Pseudomonas sp. B14(2017)]|uniref:hypothetical protein n=1 Tax=Pseudomonas sp. B14(2017) TaxID=1981745 RepID=UPI000A1EEAE4|nr:hypothetical protein [Pseudomonas sp. B14(2017)]